MSIQSAQTSLAPIIATAVVPSASVGREFELLQSELERSFCATFTLLDPAAGELLAVGAPLAIDLGILGPLCREVSRRRRPEFVTDTDPIVVLAIPLTIGTREVVALGCFPTRAAHFEDDHRVAAEVLGIEPYEAGQWLAQHSCWSTDALERMAELFRGRHAAEQRVSALSKEVEDLSLHLSRTFEEVSLLYRLTQKLKLSANDEELGKLAIQWLADAIPAESLAIFLLPQVKREGAAEARIQPLLITHGDVPVDVVNFSDLVASFAGKVGHQPLVINSTESIAGWTLPDIRQFILVPMSEGQNTFGWIAAFNSDIGEFGSVEASLLSSVAALLGIHSGNAQLYRQQKEFLANVVRAMTSAIDAKDPYTCGHSDRVARISVRLAEALGLSMEQVNTIYMAGLLHDIGKIGVEDQVLRKPGKLTDEEYVQIQRHAEIGHRILAGLHQLEPVLPVVLHHHEQWDGRGYPHQLVGEKIPLLARIVSVADAFDAMGSDRPYRQGMKEEVLDRIMREGAGKQWDPQVVEAFFKVRSDIREISQRVRENLCLDVQEWT